MNIDIQKYKSIIFDCDGVVLNSNKVKTEAFYRSALVYGEDAARALVTYHLENGGVSRYKKFTYFLEKIIGHYSDFEYKNLLDSYASYVRQGLRECEITPGLQELRDATSNAKWSIVSGGDQIELRDIFKERDILVLFDGGVFGSPDKKEDILSREIACGNISMPTVFLGDSKYDFEAARSAGLEFIFVSDWSEVPEWRLWVEHNEITYVNMVSSVLNG